MRASLSEFQEKLPQMRELADKGESVIVEDGGRTYQFHRVPVDFSTEPRFKTMGEFFEHMRSLGTIDSSNYDWDGPVIPIEEWGELWQ